MDAWAQVLVGIVAASVGTSGFWAYLTKRDTTKSATTKLMMGLAYDRIVRSGSSYISRGWLTMDEYEDLRKYFYEPYKALGGNGVADRVMNGVNGLQLRSNNSFDELLFEAEELRRRTSGT